MGKANTGTAKLSPNLDLLRSFAVALVLIDHNGLALHKVFFGLWKTQWVGVFGVYLFFVHTSLVLMESLERQPNIVNFYLRRLFRIYPLAIFVILVALAFRFPAYGIGMEWQPVSFSTSTIVANLLLVPDMLRRPFIVGVMWSLTLEVLMYVVLPFLFLIALQRKLWYFLVLWVLAVASCHTWTPGSGNQIFAVTPYFLSGIVAYLGLKMFPAVLPAWTFAPFLIVLLAIFMRDPSASHGWLPILALGLALPLFRQIRTRGFHKIAQYSYGIYLWHTFGINLCFRLFQSTVPRIVAELVFTAVVSIASYHLVEKPLIDFGSRTARIVTAAS